jgi:glycerol-3-phosphate acyltransferase PlsX
VKIAVDAMGGDHAPAAVVEGAIRAHQEYGLDVVLVGRSDQVAPILQRLGSTLPLVHAPDVIEMHEEPATAVRRKKHSSLVVCASLVKRGEADAMVTAGNTGAGTAAGSLILGRIEGIDRAALPVVLPNRSGPDGHTVLLDAGANKDVQPQWLGQFAIMGAIYAEELLGIQNPRVGLVNIGEEESKGNKLTREAFGILKHAPIRFVGNVEGPDLFNGRVDVAVCDGFTGNVILKTSEGVAEFFLHLLKEELGSSPFLMIPAAMLKPAFQRIKRRTDYGERGGAPLLGVNGVCIIGHGRSDARVIANAIRTAAEAVRHGITDKIHVRAAQARL